MIPAYTLGTFTSPVMKTCCFVVGHRLCSDVLVSVRELTKMNIEV